MTKQKFHIKDSVIVKPDVKDPDLRYNIGGWQGRIIGIEGELFHIAWDSETLRSMPEYIIIKCEQEGFDWGSMYLSSQEIEKGESRDTLKDVENITRQIQLEHSWDHLGEEGVRIQRVLRGINPEDYWACMKRWDTFLQKELSYPFEAEIAEPQDYGPLESGIRVKVLENLDIDENYGTIVVVLHKQKTYHFPLCDLEVLNKKSSNYQPVRDYVIWFANR